MGKSGCFHRKSMPFPPPSFLPFSAPVRVASLSPTTSRLFILSLYRRSCSLRVRSAVGSQYSSQTFVWKALKWHGKITMEDSDGRKKRGLQFHLFSIKAWWWLFYHQQLLRPEVCQRLQPSLSRNRKWFLHKHLHCPSYTLNVNIWFFKCFFFLILLIFRGPWRSWRAGGSVTADCQPQEDRSSQANV